MATPQAACAGERTVHINLPVRLTWFMGTVLSPATAARTAGRPSNGSVRLRGSVPPC